MTGEPVNLEQLAADVEHLRDEYAPALTCITVEVRLGPGHRITLEVSSSGTRLYTMGGQSIPLTRPRP